MDAHQRRPWARMIDDLDGYDSGTVDLAKLASDLKGLMAASDLHDPSLISAFWDHFAEIDMELELRTERWAPAGSASDERLREGLDSYRRWVINTLSSTDDERT